MVNQNPEYVKQILLQQIESVETEILSAFPQNSNQVSLQDLFQTGTRYNGNGKVEAYLAFNPDSTVSSSLDLILRLDCTSRGAMLTTEIAWSDGKMIDGIFVCNFCPDCLEELAAEVTQTLQAKRAPTVQRMVELLGNFQHA